MIKKLPSAGCQTLQDVQRRSMSPSLPHKRVKKTAIPLTAKIQEIREPEEAVVTAKPSAQSIPSLPLEERSTEKLPLVLWPLLGPAYAGIWMMRRMMPRD
jgi:hypothetical protein